MPPDPRDVALLRDMLDAANTAILYCRGRRQEDLDTDGMFADAVARRIAIVGEAARNVSESFQSLHPEIAWRPIVATRHILVHEYDNFDADIIWRIVAQHLPVLIAQLQTILAPPEPDAGHPAS